MADIEKVIRSIDRCVIKRGKCHECDYYTQTDQEMSCRNRLLRDALELLKEQEQLKIALSEGQKQVQSLLSSGRKLEETINILKGEIERLKAEKRKEEIKVGDEVASVNPATGELNLRNTFIVTEIGEDFIGGINSKGETHFHDEPGIFNIWAKTGKHIDILRAFEPVETASAKAGDQE